MAAPVITSAAEDHVQVGILFLYVIVATNSPTEYDASDLPPGLTLNTVTGIISGIPTEAGMFNPVISATNADGTGTLMQDYTVHPEDTEWPARTVRRYRRTTVY